MFKNLFKYVGKIFGAKPATLGDGLKAFKKKYGVIEEFIPRMGGRSYRCKDGRFLDIGITKYTPSLELNGNRLDKKSAINLNYGQRRSGHWSEESISRTKTSHLYKNGHIVLDIKTKKKSVGDIFARPTLRVQKTCNSNMKI